VTGRPRSVDGAWRRLRGRVAEYKIRQSVEVPALSIVPERVVGRRHRSELANALAAVKTGAVAQDQGILWISREAHNARIHHVVNAELCMQQALVSFETGVSHRTSVAYLTSVTNMITHVQYF
jgi:hypothetical protein